LDQEEEEKLLRSAALQNASSILLARQRAEDELWRTKEELERKTEELREETRALELLNRAGVVLGSRLDLQGVLQAVTDVATELSGAKFGAFFYNVTNPDGDAFMLYTLTGAPREAFEKLGHPRATPIFAPTFRGEPPIRIDDVSADPRYGRWGPHHGLPAGHLPVRSYLAAPVVSRSGEVIGGLFFAHPEPGVFTERSERLIVGVAAQAAVAVDNARLYEAALESAEERRELLVSERAAREEAERASAMKDDFLATLSHELRTPLSAIMGWAQVLRIGNIGDREMTRGLETIERNARVQTQLIEDLLDMSRITSGNLRLDIRPLDPKSVIDQAVETVGPAAAAKGITLVTTLEAGAGPVPGDASRLQQVIWNLLSNAIKFTPNDGRVRVVLQRHGTQARISVIDDGIGIRKEFLPHVFDRFRQADSSLTRTFGGLGLGLAIVKHLVELHGGSVRAESEGEGKGAAFIVDLPTVAAPTVALSAPRDAGVSGQPIPFQRVDLSGVRVLVVDDETDTREIVHRILAECRADVSAADCGAEALRQLEAHRPDVLVCDIGMPEMDGYELLKRIRALGASRGGRIPAIALTAFARSEDRTRALRAGFSVHVAKPVDSSELVATVASVLGRTDAFADSSEGEPEGSSTA
jgi:signal transduction histidine kinase/CheY-like chemotaxis protein